MSGRVERDVRCKANPVHCVRMVHFMRNALVLVPKGTQHMVAATILSVFVQPDPTSAPEPVATRRRQLTTTHWSQAWSMDATCQGATAPGQRCLRFGRAKADLPRRGELVILAFGTSHRARSPLRGSALAQ